MIDIKKLFTKILTELSGKADSSSLATVATSGSYSDLTGTPSLATVATTGAYSDLSGTPSLATVATSGSYSDLSNKPTIPTVPTNVSAFTNDAGYIANGNVSISGTLDTGGRARFTGTSYVDGNFYANQTSATCYIGCQQRGTTKIRMQATTGGRVSLYDNVNSQYLVDVAADSSDIKVAGINLSSQTTNKVLASPNGSTGAPTFRALAADDLPSHNHAASNINSGTLGVARLPNMFQIKSYSYERTTSLSAGAGVNITGTNLGVSTPSNYKPIGVVYFATSTKDVVIRWVRANVTGSSYVMGVTNVSSSAVASFTAYIDILYAYTGTVA